ncbi:type II toxin-antitoxin system Phd/YefM family antitoxin [Chlorobium sp. BLA1]|uniref:type II toxin-antitoxin system Phd/YefM family antitoxin n=1 Tax=Candidatus Chlorobium masyuteum TaxID=2716876 RepID=UPI00142135F5|nr:type II toxin-antitoxin system Phd/YefM family antitoxin [Candidatus Chlorobium masyuteum]NHQ60306.1 type II toxin-antitoxin system Phd/YefM family antitoxin [Candidatus Chlorobium masyuteum]
MTTLSVTSARAKLYKLVDDAVTLHKPVIIKGKLGNAVLLSESDWNAVSETLHLAPIPGMRESIQDGLNKEISDCSNTID